MPIPSPASEAGASARSNRSLRQDTGPKGGPGRTEGAFELLLAALEEKLATNGRQGASGSGDEMLLFGHGSDPTIRHTAVEALTRDAEADLGWERLFANLQLTSSDGPFSALAMPASPSSGLPDDLRNVLAAILEGDPSLQDKLGSGGLIPDINALRQALSRLLHSEAELDPALRTALQRFVNREIGASELPEIVPILVHVWQLVRDDKPGPPAENTAPAGLKEGVSNPLPKGEHLQNERVEDEEAAAAASPQDEAEWQVENEEADAGVSEAALALTEETSELADEGASDPDAVDVEENEETSFRTGVGNAITFATRDAVARTVDAAALFEHDGASVTSSVPNSARVPEHNNGSDAKPGISVRNDSATRPQQSVSVFWQDPSGVTAPPDVEFQASQQASQQAPHDTMGSRRGSTPLSDAQVSSRTTRGAASPPTIPDARLSENHGTTGSSERSYVQSGASPYTLGSRPHISAPRTQIRGMTPPPTPTPVMMATTPAMVAANAGPVDSVPVSQLVPQPQPRSMETADPFQRLSNTALRADKPSTGAVGLEYRVRSSIAPAALNSSPEGESQTASTLSYPQSPEPSPVLAERRGVSRDISGKAALKVASQSADDKGEGMNEINGSTRVPKQRPVTRTTPAQIELATANKAVPPENVSGASEGLPTEEGQSGVLERSDSLLQSSQMGETSRTVHHPKTANPLEQPLPMRPDPAQLSRLIQSAAIEQTQGRHTIQLQLEPESLGRLQLRVAMENGAVKAHFVAETEAARQIIEAGLPQLKESLFHHGVDIQQVDVSLGHGGGFGDRRYDQAGAEDVPQFPAGDSRKVNAVTVEPAPQTVSMSSNGVDVLI